MSLLISDWKIAVFVNSHSWLPMSARVIMIQKNSGLDDRRLLADHSSRSLIDWNTDSLYDIKLHIWSGILNLWTHCTVLLWLPTESATSSYKQRLECVASYHLFGNIVSVSSLRLPWNQRDILVLSFKDAKVNYFDYYFSLFIGQTIMGLVHFLSTPWINPKRVLWCIYYISSLLAYFFILLAQVQMIHIIQILWCAVVINFLK